MGCAYRSGRRLGRQHRCQTGYKFESKSKTNVKWRTRVSAPHNQAPGHFTSVTCSRASLYVANFFATGFRVG